MLGRPLLTDTAAAASTQGSGVGIWTRVLRKAAPVPFLRRALSCLALMWQTAIAASLTAAWVPHQAAVSMPAYSET